MMNLTSKTSKSFLLFKRALVLLCFVLCSLMANASNGTQWYAQYRAKVSNRSTGSGTVYMTATGANGNSATLTLPGDNDKEISVRSDEKTVSTRKESTYTHTFTDIKLVASALSGSEFEGWEESGLLQEYRRFRRCCR